MKYLICDNIKFQTLFQSYTSSSFEDLLTPPPSCHIKMTIFLTASYILLHKCYPFLRDVINDCSHISSFLLTSETSFEQTFFEAQFSSKEISKTSNCLLTLDLQGIKGKKYSDRKCFLSYLRLLRVENVKE